MANDLDRNGPDRERLSALVDGELDGATVPHACAHWRTIGAARATWHAYQLIGDVLRSEDLAVDPAHDAAFMAALRTRLAGEPVVLAPQPIDPDKPLARPQAAGSVRSGRSWLAPSAVAAGFAAVAGVLFMTQSANLVSPRSGAQGFAQMTPVAKPVDADGVRPVAARVGPATAPAEPQAFVATGQMIRDARLERYLAAHQQFAGSSALGVPSAFLRHATAESTGR